MFFLRKTCYMEKSWIHYGLPKTTMRPWLVSDCQNASFDVLPLFSVILHPASRNLLNRHLIAQSGNLLPPSLLFIYFPLHLIATRKMSRNTCHLSKEMMLASHAKRTKMAFIINVSQSDRFIPRPFIQFSYRVGIF